MIDIKITKDLSLKGLVTKLTIDEDNLTITSNELISFSTAESIAKDLTSKGYNQINKITFKELITI
jgi:hypothetical protein